jgi:hypothetical protein
VDVPLRGLFEQPTIARLASLVDQALQVGATTEILPIQPAPRSGKLPLSFAQERLWFLDQLEPGSPLYNIPTAVQIRGDLDTAALEASLREIIRRHEVLRTTFETVAGRPQQRIHDDIALELDEIDLRSFPDQEQRRSAIRRHAIAEARKPFDLARGPLVRGLLLRVFDEEHVFLWTMHHIVSDGWSMGVLLRELAEYYRQYRQSRTFSLPALPFQYADYAAWQREYLEKNVLESQLSYWKHALAGAPQVLDLPADKPRPALQTYRGATERFIVQPELTARLDHLGRSEGATLFMTALAAFQLVLSRYSRQEDVCVGTPIAGRNRSELESLVGFFVNTLVLRGDLSGAPSFRRFLQRVRETTLGAYAHQELPFDRIVNELQPQRDLSRSPLFQVMFAWQNAPMPALQVGELELTPIEPDTGTAKFDLSLLMREWQGGLIGHLEYNTDLFEQASMQRLIGHFLQGLQEIVENPDQRVTEFSLITPEERQKLLSGWNDTRAELPPELNLPRMFEKQAARTPQAVAVVCGGRQLTYG